MTCIAFIVFTFVYAKQYVNVLLDWFEVTYPTLYTSLRLHLEQ